MYALINGEISLHLSKCSKTCVDQEMVMLVVILLTFLLMMLNILLKSVYDSCPRAFTPGVEAQGQLKSGKSPSSL